MLGIPIPVNSLYLGCGLLKPHLLFSPLGKFSILLKYVSDSLNHVHIWQVSPQLGCQSRKNMILGAVLRPRQNGHHFPDDIFKCIFFNENVCLSITISLKFVPKGPTNNIPALVPDNGLGLNRRQAIIWTNDGLVYWCIYASLGLNEWIIDMPMA